jgi:glycosyltransferase involved in cell wall biosynthesis
MLLGLPVLTLATTAAPESVPAAAGVVSSDPAALAAAARRWLADPDEARARGRAARAHALDRFGLDRFLSDWHRLLKEVV